MTARILIADDDPASRLRLQRTLAGCGYEVTAVGDGLAAWEALERMPPDSSVLAILDWQMPGLDGVELTARIKADALARYTYVVVLTSRAGTPDVVAAMDAGADDFVAKPFEPDELKVRVRAGVRILQMQAELRRRASHDELSAALTRRWVLELADRELIRARREGAPLSLAMIDIDHFKRVNDTHGHPAGDAVIRQVAGRLKGALRASDLLGRYGGEEFVVVLPDCDRNRAGEVAERMRAAIAAVPIVAGDASLALTVSIGVTTAGRGDSAAERPSLPALVHTADRALYRAKAAGRDRVMVG
jgi:two-component system cell cycle response regulator